MTERATLRAMDLLRALTNYAPNDASIPIWLVLHLQNAIDEASGAFGEKVPELNPAIFNPDGTPIS